MAKNVEEVDGAQISALVGLCSPAQLSRLVGAEFSNATDEWIVKGIDKGSIELESLADQTMTKQNLSFVNNGTFFIDKNVWSQLDQIRQAALTPGQVALAKAQSHLAALGFSVAKLGWDQTRFLSDLLTNCQHGSYPDKGQWPELHALVKEQSDRSANDNLCAIIPILQRWLNQSEAKLGRCDLYRRVTWAVACRHSGQLQKALEVSEVVNQPHPPSADRSVAVLCTTRAATMMDLVRGQADSCARLTTARKLLDRANLINARINNDGHEVMFAYRRLKKLEKDYKC